ncbi:response regulator [Changpingibacter yushuensis]|uniref:response regulator n=1 Tax=Changpingibacter yushuensis TaxID=2758440 RepID=UPI00165EBD23|nr:response regulator transcription factor [Changpingibacter yushuensis]
MTGPASVLIVDDHALFRDGMAALISRWDDFEVVGSVGSGAEGVAIAHEAKPDLVLMDVRMNGMNGVEATRQICLNDRAIRVVMLTMSSLGEDLLQALKVGAYGFLGKDEPAERLHGYLQGVMRGETALSSAAANMVLTELRVGNRQQPRRDLTPTLTMRENDVLQLVVEGLSNEEIACQLHLSEGTVKKYLGNVMSKLHLKNRVQVAVHAVRHGVVP